MGLHATLSVIAGLGHLGLVIYLFVDPSGAVQKLQDYAIAKDHAPRWGARAPPCTLTFLPHLSLPFSSIGDERQMKVHAQPLPSRPGVRDTARHPTLPHSVSPELTLHLAHARRSSLAKAVSIGRWVLLGLLSLQAVAVLFALIVRRVLRRRAYEEFKDVEAPAQQARRAQREADMQDLREKVLGSQHALAGRAQPATALDFKIATVAAANRAELMGGEDESLAAVDPRSSAVPQQAAAAPAPPPRHVGVWWVN